MGPRPHRIRGTNTRRPLGSRRCKKHRMQPEELVGIGSQSAVDKGILIKPPPHAWVWRVGLRSCVECIAGAVTAAYRHFCQLAVLCRSYRALHCCGVYKQRSHLLLYLVPCSNTVRWEEEMMGEEQIVVVFEGYWLRQLDSSESTTQPPAVNPNRHVSNVKKK